MSSMRQAGCGRCSGARVLGGGKCHERRTYYKNRDRYNKQRRQQYRVNQGASPQHAAVETARGVKTLIRVITVPVPQSVAAIVHFYRVNKMAPLHAIAAELYRNGEKVIEVEPVNTLGWTGTQVKQYMRHILRSFSEHTGMVVSVYEFQVEHVQAYV